MSTEADTCRKNVLPRLSEAGWDTEPHSFTEQRSFTDGRIIVTGSRFTRRPQKRADCLLRYTRDFSIAVVDAKADFKSPYDGLQQADEDADRLLMPYDHVSGKSPRYCLEIAINRAVQAIFQGRWRELPVGVKPEMGESK